MFGAPFALVNEVTFDRSAYMLLSKSTLRSPGENILFSDPDSTLEPL